MCGYPSEPLLYPPDDQKAPGPGAACGSHDTDFTWDIENCVFYENLKNSTFA